MAADTVQTNLGLDDPSNGAFNPNKSWNTWNANYQKAEGKWQSNFSYFKNLLYNFEHGDSKKTSIGFLLMFATQTLLPDKMVLGQVDMEKKADEVSDLSYLTRQINALQDAFAFGNTSDPTTDFNNFKTAYNNLKNEIANDKWLNGSGGVAGTMSSTQLANLKSELGAFSQLAEGSSPAALVLAQEELKNGSSTSKTYTNALSELTNQVQGVSSYEKSELQYTQQNYTKISQAIQDILTSIVKVIGVTTNNTSKI